jgi:hypothetical protein
LFFLFFIFFIWRVALVLEYAESHICPPSLDSLVLLSGFSLYFFPMRLGLAFFGLLY